MSGGLASPRESVSRLSQPGAGRSIRLRQSEHVQHNFWLTLDSLAMPICRLPEQRHSVIREMLVTSDNRKPFNLRLGDDQQP